MSDQDDLSGLLEGSFGAVSVAGCRRMVESARTIEVPRGGHVLREGDPADALYVVMSGTIQLGLHQRERDLAVASVGPGELLGWSWLVPPHRWDFDAVAVSGARLARIPAEVLRSVMRDDPADASAIGAVMLAVLGRRLRDTRIQLLDLFAGSTTPGTDA